MNGIERRENERYGSNRVEVRRAAPRPPPLPPREPARVKVASPGHDGHTFTCRGSLLRAFEERAAQLGCSLDWLFAEALRRTLDEPVDEPIAVPSVEAPTRVRTTAPLPPPMPRPSADVGAIQLRTHTSDGTICEVVTNGMVIGRSESEAGLLLVHRGVSRKHARLERREHGWVVVDLASFNGVYVNSMRTRCSPIVPGDVIGIGPFAVTVERA